MSEFEKRKKIELKTSFPDMIVSLNDKLEEANRVVHTLNYEDSKLGKSIVNALTNTQACIDGLHKHLDESFNSTHDTKDEG